MEHGSPTVGQAGQLCDGVIWQVELDLEDVQEAEAAMYEERGSQPTHIGTVTQRSNSVHYGIINTLLTFQRSAH
jgi:hypothetical protein